MPQQNGQHLNYEEFEVEITKDGSPTLRIKHNATLNGKNAESMHHSAGAASETFYIYQSPFQLALKHSKSNNINVMVVGLGLGYIEFAVIRTVLTSAQKNKHVNIVSYEKSLELKNRIQKWIQLEESNKVYEDVLDCVNLYKISGDSTYVLTKQNLQKVINLQSHIHWFIKGELSETTESLSDRVHFVAFDAFSSATDNPLWTESFLDRFIKNNCAEDCVFTTYAATGTLKKVLLNNGFLILKRKGFSGKRESTLAVRGLFRTQAQFFQSDLSTL